MATRATIIGAGISGLSAAYFLGRETEIFEASSEAGGRVRAANIGNQWVDLGAQFIAKEDKHAMGLVKSLGLSKKLKVFDLRNFFVCLKGHKLDSRHLFELASLEIKEIEELFLFLEGLDEKKFGKLQEEIAHETLEEWYRREFGEEMLWLIDSMCRTVTFSDAKELSAIFGLAVVSSFVEECYSFDKGINEIAISLLKESKAKINYGSKVNWLEFGKSNRITVEKNGVNSELKGGKILSTVPAPELARIVGEKDLVKALNKIEYAGCGVVVFETDEKVFGGKLGAMFPKEKISAAFDATARFGNKEGVEELIVALVPFKGDERPDFAKAALKSLNEFDREFESKVRSTTVVEWELGLPVCSPSLFETQMKIQESCPEGLLVAGDFMGLPSLDASIETALACAKGLNKTR